MNTEIRLKKKSAPSKLNSNIAAQMQGENPKSIVTTDCDTSVSSDKIVETYNAGRPK
jgi:hypothetical protein